MELSAAGQSSSIESSNSGPTCSASSSSSGPAAAGDSFGSEAEDSWEPGQQVNVRVISLLSRLKLPRPSDFTQKYVV